MFCLKGSLMHKKKLFLFAVLLSFGSFHGSVSATTLQQSAIDAIASHPSIDTALAERVIAKEDKNEARSGYFPQISAGVTGGRLYADNTTSRGLTIDRGAGYSWLGEGNIAITQPLFNGLETPNRVQAAASRGGAADFEVQNVKENVILQAVQAHINAYQAQDKIEKIDIQIREMASYQERIQLLVDEGVSDDSEITQAKNIILFLEEERLRNEGQLKIALAHYHEAVGHYPRSKLQKPPSMNDKIQPNIDAVIPSLASHPSVQAGEFDVEAQGYEVKAEQGGYYPTLDSELSYLKRDQRDIIGGESEDARAVLRLAWDFETGGAQGARVRRAQAQYSELLSENKEVLKRIEGEVRRAYVEYETAEKQKVLIRNRQQITQQLFDTYETQFEGAQVRLLQLMQGKNQLFSTHLEVLDADSRSLLAQYSILASLGSLEKVLTAFPAVQ